MAHWIVKKNYRGELTSTCSECGYGFSEALAEFGYVYDSPSCPYCKAAMTDEMEFTNTAKLQDMPQYHLGREVLCNVVRETIGYDVLMDAFCYGTFNQSDEFAWFTNDDEFYIVHLPSGMMINWYKHLGRTNTCSQVDRTLEDYYEFFKRFKMDLEYWAESKNIKLG